MRHAQKTLVFAASLVLGACADDSDTNERERFSAPARASGESDVDWSTRDTRPEVQGLTTTEREQLQDDVNALLSETPGGTQISANEVSYDAGESSITLPFPGEEPAT